MCSCVGCVFVSVFSLSFSSLSPSVFYLVSFSPSLISACMNAYQAEGKAWLRSHLAALKSRNVASSRSCPTPDLS